MTPFCRHKNAAPHHTEKKRRNEQKQDVMKEHSGSHLHRPATYNSYPSKESKNQKKLCNLHTLPLLEAVSSIKDKYIHTLNKPQFMIGNQPISSLDSMQFQKNTKLLC